MGYKTRYKLTDGYGEWLPLYCLFFCLWNLPRVNGYSLTGRVLYKWSASGKRYPWDNFYSHMSTSWAIDSHSKQPFKQLHVPGRSNHFRHFLYLLGILPLPRGENNLSLIADYRLKMSISLFCWTAVTWRKRVYKSHRACDKSLSIASDANAHFFAKPDSLSYSTIYGHGADRLIEFRTRQWQQWEHQ